MKSLINDSGLSGDFSGIPEKLGCRALNGFVCPVWFLSLVCFLL